MNQSQSRVNQTIVMFFGGSWTRSQGRTYPPPNQPGEETPFSDFGEFRHYLSEKAAYNKVNRGDGKEMVDVSPSVLRLGGEVDATAP